MNNIQLNLSMINGVIYSILSFELMIYDMTSLVWLSLPIACIFASIAVIE